MFRLINVIVSMVIISGCQPDKTSPAILPDGPDSVSELDLPSPVICACAFGDSYLLGCGYELVVVDNTLVKFKSVLKSKFLITSVAASVEKTCLVYGYITPEKKSFAIVLNPSFQVLHTIVCPDDFSVDSLAISSDSAILAVSLAPQNGQECKTLYYSLENGKQAGFPASFSEKITSTAYSLNNKFLAVCHSDGTVIVYSPKNHAELLKINDGNKYSSSLFSADSKNLILYGFGVNEICVLDLSTMTKLSKLSFEENLIGSVVAIDSKGTIAASFFDGSIRVWKYIDLDKPFVINQTKFEGGSFLAYSKAKDSLLTFCMKKAKSYSWRSE